LPIRPLPTGSACGGISGLPSPEKGCYMRERLLSYQEKDTEGQKKKMEYLP